PARTTGGPPLVRQRICDPVLAGSVRETRRRSQIFSLQLLLGTSPELFVPPFRLAGLTPETKCPLPDLLLLWHGPLLWSRIPGQCRMRSDSSYPPGFLPMMPSSLRTAAAELPTLSMVFCSSSFDTLSAWVQYFTSCGWCMLILLRSG